MIAMIVQEKRDKCKIKANKKCTNAQKKTDN